ncbi:hypothetical protein OTB74_36220, partial [Streptomyces sp. H34-S4]|nr:hypothetical protein [Streptomyces sp. H34-S4]
MTNSAPPASPDDPVAPTAPASDRTGSPLRSLLPPTPSARPLALSTALHTMGTGLVVTLCTIYFTRIVGLSVSQVGTG